MKRKKWTEAEEATLIDVYEELTSSGAISRLSSREKRFRPVAERVNSVHHDPVPDSFPFRWSWRDVSVKIQNMRHQFLNIRRKILLPDGSLNCDLGLHLWPNLLRYQRVFGDQDDPSPQDQLLDMNRLDHEKVLVEEDVEEEAGGGGGGGGGSGEEGEAEEVQEGEEESGRRKAKTKRAIEMARRILEVREAGISREEGRAEEEDEWRRWRRRREERREEEERDWVASLVGMQMQHEREVMQLQAGSCQVQAQAACVLARVVCQLLGPVLGDTGVAGGMMPPHAGMVNIPGVNGQGQDQGSIGPENGKSDTSSPGQYL